VGDITYNWTEEGWLYTAIVKDLCTKDIVGYAMSDRITKELAIRAMEMAIRIESPEPGLIFHSDRGSQYCSNDYQALLKMNGITPSMSRKGTPYDNAVAENFFSNLKCECTNFYNFKSRAEAKQVIFEYIEVYYNRQRRHSGCYWLTPKRYKKMLFTKRAA
jgi:putative transposase